MTLPIRCLSCMSVSNYASPLLHQLPIPSRDAVRDIVEPALTEQSLQNRRNCRWRSGTRLGELGYLFWLQRVARLLGDPLRHFGTIFAHRFTIVLLPRHLFIAIEPEE